MNKKLISILFILTTIYGCGATDSNKQEPPQLVLKENFSEQGFKEAIIGKWKSVWKHSTKKNIDYLELNKNGGIKIIIDENGNLKEIRGSYNISFIRPPTEGSITLAEITIKTSNDNIVLSRVNFGFHNALPMDRCPFLRIDSEPFGVLEKIKASNNSKNRSFRALTEDNITKPYGQKF